MYGARSPLVPIVLAYAGGLSIGLLLGAPFIPSFLLSALFSIAALYALISGFSYPYRHLPGLFLILAWSFAGMSAMAWENKVRGWEPGKMEKEETGELFMVQVRTVESLEARGSSFRGELVEQELPVLLEVRGKGARELLPGDRLLSPKAPEAFQAPRGPAAFDRKSFYADQGIHYRIKLDPHDPRVIEEKVPWDLRVLALRWRERLYRGLRDETGLDGAELAVASALWLGRKQELPGELREEYADAGGMHVLAVSGLHVGIVYFMLQLFCTPLKNSVRGERAIPWIIIAVLWAYAMLTGFSPSVIRAVLMFSLYSVGQSLDRSPRVGNAIAGSALLVLLFDPRMIEDIGFLLSYSAVLSIVTLYPRIERIWTPPSKAIAWLWSLLSVSTAAQIGVLPIVLGVFGKFPLWFAVSNPILLPLATLVLYTGPLVAASSLFPQGLQWSSSMVESLLELMNGWVSFVAEWHGSGIRIGPLAPSLSFLLAAAISCSIMGVHKKLPGWSVQLSWTLFLLILLLKDIEREDRAVLLQHSGRDPPVTAVRRGEKVLLWSPGKAEGYRKRSIVEYWRGRGLEAVWKSGLNKGEVQGIEWNGLKLLFIDRPVQDPLPESLDRKWDLLLLGPDASWKGEWGEGTPEASVLIILSPKAEWELDRAEEKLHILPEEGAYIEPLS